MATARTATALNITNGDTVVYLFKKAGILGTHVPWRDVLYEGPVPNTDDISVLRAARAQYISDRGYNVPIRVFRDFEARDATIARAAQFEEVVLWFEHDLYDQLQIAQILPMLASLDIEPGRISIVQSDAYLGTMTAEELAALHPKRKTVTSAGFDAAQRVWSAFTSGDRERLNELTRTDFAQLPFMRAGMRRLLEEFPWTSDGLGRSQRQALQAVAAGPVREEELYRRAQGREESPFLADVPFAAVLRDLASGPQPLLARTDDEPYELTPLGRRIVAGDGDWIEEAGIDRWIGGFHLNAAAGAHLPRFDERSERLV